MRIDSRKGYELNGIQLSSLKSLLYSALVLKLALIFSMPAAAQRITGTLRGQILDPSGAAVPNAQITATNEDTGVSIKISATSAGTYDFPSLIPGRYSVTIESTGFKKLVKNDVPVLADQDNVADAKLELGATGEVVEVVAGAVEVQTSDSSINYAFDAKDVADLPQ